MSPWYWVSAYPFLHPSFSSKGGSAPSFHSSRWFFYEKQVPPPPHCGESWRLKWKQRKEGTRKWAADKKRAPMRRSRSVIFVSLALNPNLDMRPRRVQGYLISEAYGPPIGTCTPKPLSIIREGREGRPRWLCKTLMTWLESLMIASYGQSASPTAYM